jgi:NADPH:quinone reductase-like Zn-dependent oxidoreductase
MFVAKECGTDLEALTPLLQSGQVTPALDSIFPLSQAPAAMRHLMTGQVRGKIAIST